MKSRRVSFKSALADVDARTNKLTKKKKKTIVCHIDPFDLDDKTSEILHHLLKNQSPDGFCLNKSKMLPLFGRTDFTHVMLTNKLISRQCGTRFHDYHVDVYTDNILGRGGCGFVEEITGTLCVTESGLTYKPKRYVGKQTYEKISHLVNKMWDEYVQQEVNAIINITYPHYANMTPLQKLYVDTQVTSEVLPSLVDKKDELITAYRKKLLSKRKKEFDQEYTLSKRVRELGVKPPTVLSNGNAVMVMHYLNGKDGEYLIKKDQSKRRQNKNKIATNVRIETAIKVTRDLQKLHAKNIVHRDIKTSNVMLNLQSSPIQAQIVDLGLSRDARIEDGRIVGSPLYASPEYFNKRLITGKSDF